jgi:putative ABC transport system ATP-binding protein
MTALAYPLDRDTAAAAETRPEGVVVMAGGLVRRYGEGDTAVEALRGVSLGIETGKMTAIMGPSGSGKSTLMHLLAGLDTPTEGTIVVDGIEITTLSEKNLTRLRRDTIGFVFQFFNLLPMLTAEENVTLPLEIAGTKVDKTWLNELLENVGITARRNHRPAELSGGQQQRVAVARALVTKPKVLFADEPTGNLDSQSSKEVLQLLRRSVDEWGQTIVMVTHDAGAAAMADRILFLADGRIVRDLEESTAAEVLAAMQEVGSR